MQQQDKISELTVVVVPVVVDNLVKGDNLEGLEDHALLFAVSHHYQDQLEVLLEYLSISHLCFSAQNVALDVLASFSGKRTQCSVVNRHTFSPTSVVNVCPTLQLFQSSIHNNVSLFAVAHSSL